MKLQMENAHKEIDLMERMDDLYKQYIAQHGNPVEQNKLESDLAALQFRYHNLTGESYNVRQANGIQ